MTDPTNPEFSGNHPHGAEVPTAFRVQAALAQALNDRFLVEPETAGAYLDALDTHVRFPDELDQACLTRAVSDVRTELDGDPSAFVVPSMPAFVGKAYDALAYDAGRALEAVETAELSLVMTSEHEDRFGRTLTSPVLRVIDRITPHEASADAPIESPAEYERTSKYPVEVGHLFSAAFRPAHIGNITPFGDPVADQVRSVTSILSGYDTVRYYINRLVDVYPLVDPETQRYIAGALIELNAELPSAQRYDVDGHEAPESVREFEAIMRQRVHELVTDAAEPVLQVIDQILLNGVDNPEELLEIAEGEMFKKLAADKASVAELDHLGWPAQKLPSLINTHIEVAFQRKAKELEARIALGKDAVAMVAADCRPNSQKFRADVKR